MKFNSILLLVLSITFIKSCQSKNLTYDFCNINESKVANGIILNILEYFSLNNKDSKQCQISTGSFTDYVESFIKLENFNKNAYSQFKCPMCEKKFKNKNFLNMHYKIFHLSRTNKNDIETSTYCPADFCRFINCDRYKRYLGLTYDSIKDNSFSNRQPQENIQECNKELIEFYRKSCMKMINNCLGSLTEESSAEKYYEYFNNFCLKIKCNKDDPVYNSFNQDLQPEGGMYDALRLLILYIVSIFIIIYLLIIWVSKYS
jgi:hypothetical protein